MFSFLLSPYLEVKLLDHKVTLTLRGTARLFFISVTMYDGSISSPTLVLSDIFIIVILVGVE